MSKPSEGLYKEKGSKFLAFAYPITSENEAKDKIQELRELHPKAVHVCFAWRLGVSNYHDRYSDDGEPNNSAGKPIFGQILAAEITNVLVAVVRYYGGTKLGVGGLINAYKTATAEAIEKNTIIQKEEVIKAIIKFDPSNTGDLMSRLNKMRVEVKSHGFENALHLVKIDIVKSVSKEIIDTFEQLPHYQIELIE
nr:YigZ family protein [Paracrocinitomix mangrovi]